MLERVSVVKIVVGASVLLALLFAIGWWTREDPADKPYLRILGGGFIVNYRVADVYYGFSAIVQRPLPTGTIVEAAFENPEGGAPFIVRQRMGGPEMTQFSMRSPPVKGVRAGQPYTVSIRILDRTESQVLWSYRQEFRSQVGSDIAPDKPLTIGPGYTPNPAAGN